MKLRLAQYGISHDHASGKAHVMKESDEIDFAGVFEPSPEVRETLGQSPVYEGVHWFTSKEEILEDETIVGVAAQGRVSQNLTFAREILEHGKHVWFDKPAGDNLDAFREVLDIARDRNLLVQLGYMFRYNAGFQFILDWANSGKLGDIFSVRARISSGPSSENTLATLGFTRRTLGRYYVYPRLSSHRYYRCIVGTTHTGDTLFEARWT